MLNKEKVVVTLDQFEVTIPNGSTGGTPEEVVGTKAIRGLFGIFPVPFRFSLSPGDPGSTVVYMPTCQVSLGVDSLDDFINGVVLPAMIDVSQLTRVVHCRVLATTKDYAHSVSAFADGSVTSYRQRIRAN